MAVRLTIELDREADGRWIAEIPELTILLYGESKPYAIERLRMRHERSYAIEFLAGSQGQASLGCAETNWPAS